MMNLEVSMILQHIGDLLEVRGESSFKVNAYRRAAKSIESLGTGIEELFRDGKLQLVRGIGKGLSAKIEEILVTGKSAYLEELSRTTPSELQQLLKIPWVGPKKVKLFREQLGIETLEQLEEACIKKTLRTLPGIGAKTEGNILRGIRALRSRDTTVPWGVADLIASTVLGRLLRHKSVTNASISGSMRRVQESIDRVEIVAEATDCAAVEEFVRGFIDLIDHETIDDGKVRLVFPPFIPVDVTIVPEGLFHLTLWLHTGSDAHCRRIERLAQENGYAVLSLVQHRTCLLPEDLPVSEKEIYQGVGLEYVPPELREDFGEVEAAASSSLPHLVHASDIKGDLHMHTLWSDGGNSVEEMVEGARKLGYEYIAITEHSKSLRVANGISEDKLHKQLKKIYDLNQRYDDIAILTGIEVDILQDGTLDFPDSVLRKLDIVIASIHTGFRQDEETITKRILSALESKYVDILAHPTGRLLGRRDGYSVDMEAILRVAKDTGTILEINSSPDRLDLGSEYVRRCKEMGIPVVINTDAHSIEQLYVMKFGVGVARKGWLSKEDVVNTYPLGGIPLPKKER
jgi:DNA polymerase (family 10)